MNDESEVSPEDGLRAVNHVINVIKRMLEFEWEGPKEEVDSSFRGVLSAAE